MSPVKIHHKHSVMNGPRPAPLKISKASNAIHRTASSFETSVVPLAFAGAKRRNRPVIIYTHSPKVIHAQPKDFMALVQKLTGLSHPVKDHEIASLSLREKLSIVGSKADEDLRSAGSDDNVSSSLSTDDENFGGGLENNKDHAGVGNDDIPTIPESQDNPFFADMPLFTPNSANFFCSPRSNYKFPDPGSASLNMGNLISSSALEFLKRLPEY